MTHYSTPSDGASSLLYYNTREKAASFGTRNSSLDSAILILRLLPEIQASPLGTTQNTLSEIQEEAQEASIALRDH